MLNFLNSRRGGSLGSGILYFIYLLMMVMILSGIAGGFYAYFGKGYDFRQREADALMNQVRSCFSEHNFFSGNFSANRSLFYDKCRLSKNSLEDGNHLVYVQRLSDKQEFFAGVYDYTVRCGLIASKKNRSLPLCTTQDFDGYRFVTASSQNSRRAAA